MSSFGNAVPSWGEQTGPAEKDWGWPGPLQACLGMGWPWTSWGAISIEKMPYQKSLKWHYLLKKLFFS